MGVPTIKTGPMTVEEFYAFTDRRPDNEKWELIDGEPILNASPSPIHQWIVKNLVIALGLRERQPNATWAVLPGLGCRDVNEVIVAFEVLSPSTEDRDLRWKRTAFTSLPSLTHYVVVAQDAVDAVVFARDAGFAERHLRLLGDSLELASLGISLPLAEIYRDIGLE